MKGMHRVIIENDHVRYDFQIRRNITILQGDSATGKTSLLDILRQYSQRGIGSGITLQSDKRCVVYGGTNDNWRVAIESEKDSIIFIDEDYSFVFSRDFADCIKNTSNYYVLISRRPLKELPYSTKEIYGIRTSGRYHFPEKVYNEFYPIYPEKNEYGEIRRTILIVEDSNSGFQFFEKINKNIKCISAEGNTNVYNLLCQIRDNEYPLTVIADGAAFGAYIESVLSISRIRKDVSIYLPESFEWLVLKSGVIYDSRIEDILDSPEDYIESSEHFSWERFFTDTLTQLTKNDPITAYSKKKLPPYYLDGRNRERILSVLPDDLRKAME